MALETRQAPPQHLLFKIESFSLLKQCGIDKYETREFGTGNYKWRLVIYPNGHGIQKAEEYVSVYLAISDTKSLPVNWEVNAVFFFFIFNQVSGNYLHTPGKTSRFFALKTEWGIPKFISRKDLAIPSNGYIVDDSCVFGAEVFVIDKYSPVMDCLSLKNVNVPYKRAIKISNFSTLKITWYSEEFTARGSKWKIQINPNGSGEGAGSSLSMFLVYVPSINTNSKVKAHYSICLQNQVDSIKNYKGTTSHWFESSIENCWGWPSFISLDKLNAADSGFIVKDTCLLEIEISVQAVAAQ